MNILIPMAGLATRFVNEGITTPKPLIKVAGKTLIEHTLETLGLDGKHIFVVRRCAREEDNIELGDLLRKLRPGCHIVPLSKPTNGAVETCLAAQSFIDNDEPLIITNCDQRTEWDSRAFLENIADDGVSGCVVTHESSEPKHSYARLDLQGNVEYIVEKEVISSHALIGVHYWAHGSDFVQSATALMESNISDGSEKEPYVSETYNKLIAEGKIITAFQVGKNEYIPLGTPYDVAMYEARLREYHTEKPKTIFLDLDGSILKHLHRFSDIPSSSPALLEGVLEKINHWDSIGHRIILCTARKESARGMTEQHLRGLGLCWDQLIMGLTSGERVLINDKLTEASKDRAIAVNLLTNKGFGHTEWEKLGL